MVGMALTVYGSFFEAIGTACFYKKLNVAGCITAIYGGMACVLGAQTLPAHLFVSVQALGIPRLWRIWLLLRESYVAGFWLFLVAAGSDAVDGFVARHFRMGTDLGTVLDPLADKALLVGIYVTLGGQGHIPVWLVALVVLRDVLILGGALMVRLVTGYLNVKPVLVSKLNTAVQILLVVAVLAQLAFGVAIGPVVTFLVFAVAATTVVSGAVYTLNWARQHRYKGAVTRSDR